MTKKYGKPDANHSKIVNYIRSIGGVVLDCKSLINAFDILVGYKGKLYIIEIKNPERLLKKLPKKERLEKALTKGERDCKIMFESVGCEYNIVESCEDINILLDID